MTTDNYKDSKIKYFKLIDFTILILPILFILGSPWTNACTVFFSYLFISFSIKKRIGNGLLRNGSFFFYYFGYTI